MNAAVSAHIWRVTGHVLHSATLITCMDEVNAFLSKLTTGSIMTFCCSHTFFCHIYGKGKPYIAHLLQVQRPGDI